MVFKKTWARDFRFRSKIKQIELPSKFKKLFLMYMGGNKNNIQYLFLRRKMNRYGLTIPTRRCILTGRPRGFMRDFHVSRHKFKNLVEQGFFHGITKSSW
jgi:ribosomal protein S14